MYYRTLKLLQMPCQKIISGGQTGVDRGALDAALSFNFPCGGWCPKGRMAEDGPIEKKYPLKETIEKSYSTRTKLNVTDSDGTLIIYNKQMTGGTKLTYQFTLDLKKPVFLIQNSGFYNTEADKIFKWMDKFHIGTLNIAGPRQSDWKEGYKMSKKITKMIISHYSNPLQQKDNI